MLFFDKVFLGDMMKKIIEKRNYIILFIIIILIIWILFSEKRVYVKSFNFKDALVTYVIYDNVDENKITNNIERIYKKFEKKSLSEKEKNLIFSETDGYFDEIRNYFVSYSTKEVLKFFDSYGIKKYMVNVDGDVILGDRHLDKNYLVSIHNPNDNSVLKIISLSNKSLSTVRYYNELKSLKGSRRDYDMVSVICKDNITSNIISNYIYYLSIEEGEKVLSRNNCDGLWYKNNRIITSSNFSKYFNKKL